MTIKDAMWLIALITTNMATFLGFRATLKNMQKEIRRNKRVIYGDQGKLNIIDESTCKAHRDMVFDKIRSAEKAADMMLLKIDELNKNVLTILVYLNIKSPNGLNITKGE